MRMEDERLDRLLTSLSTVEPGEGFEERVVQAVHRRRAASRPTRIAAWTWTVGGATALACAMFVAAELRPWRDPQVGQPLLSSSSVATAEEGKANAKDAKVAQRTQRRAVMSARMGERHDVLQVERGEERMVRVESFPAPPAPLTEQEKLLLKIAHSGDPVELAALNPEIAEGLEDKSRSEVQKFFYKPPVIDDKGNLIASADKGDKQ